MGAEAVPSNFVYIGGIPFDQTEEQVLEIAKTVGPVQLIQLIIDKETGKSKGYAFVEYNDVLTASSAVRNLSSYNIGNRVLKCSFSNENAILDPFGNQNSSSQQGSNNYNNNNNNSHMNNKKKQSIPPLPPGVDVYNGTPAEAIIRELQRMDQGRLSIISNDAIRMAKSNPQLMEELLVKNPQLSFAIVEASMMVNKISDKDLAPLLKEDPKEVIEQEVAEQALTEEQKSLIKQVVALSEQQINGLSEEQKRVVYQLKGQYLGVV